MRYKFALPFSIVLFGLISMSSVTGASIQAAGSGSQRSITQQPDHIVIVVEENHSYKEIKGNASAPYMNQLFDSGASLTNHYATRHPSQPNYLDLFSGSEQGVKGDGVPKTKFSTDNLGAELIRHGYTFAGYSEGLPRTGYNGPYDLKTGYARKHNPWVNFTNVPSSLNKPFTDFPSDYSKLPTVSFVIPNLAHDIHDGTIKEADQWLQTNLGRYVKWAKSHNSMLILTWDEDDLSAKNKIPTVLVGPMMKNTTVTQRTTHYSVLRTIEELYGLEYAGQSKYAKSLPVFKA
ncbi:alkaline phosphatase family protein [Paenibacillus aurantiacus]|uniref:Alkaline phosphatase family protein n=1 Tax=Paenibacillus aurantiacus TaxID=1936118 RepID=A0ABV5KTZ9_9BACL